MLKPVRASRRHAIALKAGAALTALTAAAWAQTTPQPSPAQSAPLAMDMQLDARVPMRDGITLSARIWRPSKAGRFPVVLQHTPYLSDETQTRARKFVAADYVYVSLDRRGRGTSEGTFVPLEGTGPDGADAIAWLARQPWSDGRVVTMGGSYRGMAQWQTLAESPPALKAAVPTAAVYPGWDYPAPRGIPYGYMAQWLAFVDGRASNAQLFADEAYWREKFMRVYRGEVPFSRLAEISGAPQGHFTRWLDHPGDDAYWRSVNPSPSRYARMTPPILTITGYFDGDQDGAMRYYDEHQRYASAEAARQHLLLIGPWDHAGTRYPRDSVGGLRFDARAVLDIDRLHVEWFDHLLRGKPRPQALADRVNYYVMGAEEWRSAPDLSSVAPHRWTLFLRADGSRADSPFASGRLANAPADAEPPSRFVFDPRQDNFPADWAQRPINADDYVRDDDALRRPQLFFVGGPLRRARTICGRIEFDAMIAIDVPDTDVRVDLHAIDADNRIVWLGGDNIRARFRADPGRESTTEAGAVLPWRFDRFWWTCRRLDAGTRLRLTIGPVDHPYLQKNLNSGGRIGHERMADARIATISLHHDRTHPSVLRLPVIEPE
jgi:putative CocE/NonD family hydrolase